MLKIDFVKGAKSVLSAGIAFLMTFLPAFSHVVFIPSTHTNLSLLHPSTLAHASLSHTLYFGKISSRTALASLPGAGSYATRLNNNLVKQIIFSGFNQGQSIALSHAIGGAVNSGLIFGPEYINYGNGVYSYYQSYWQAFGNSSYNTGFYGFQPSVSSAPQYISFANNGLVNKHGGAGGGTGGIGVTLGTSGASRALNGYFNQVAGVSTAAGLKSIQSLGPITGGAFNGTFWQGTGGGTAYAALKIFVPFGNNPLATAGYSIVPNSLIGNYVLFGNTMRTVTGGQYQFSLISANTFNNGSGNGFAFGNSPLNVGITHQTIPLSAFKAAIYYLYK